MQWSVYTSGGSYASRSYGVGTATVISLSAALPAPSPTSRRPKSSRPLPWTSVTPPRRPVTSTGDITINRWSTDAERDRLLRSSRQGAVGVAVGAAEAAGRRRHQRTGFAEVRRPLRARTSEARGRSYDFPHDRPLHRRLGGPRIGRAPSTIPLADPVCRWTRTAKGVGKASIATKITEAADGTIELENFSNQPVALNEVRRSSSEARGAVIGLSLVSPRISRSSMSMATTLWQPGE